MKSIPLTRARHAANFAVALAQKGVSPTAYLGRSHLPDDLSEASSGDRVISAIGMLDFAERAATATGIRDLGYWAGTIPIAEYGDFGLRVVKAPNLNLAIRTFCRTVRDECSEADYYLKYEQSTAWFCHGRNGGDSLQHQHELYALMIMMQVIRLALGAHWKPAHIRLQRQDETGAADNDFLLATNIEFGSLVTGIQLPLEKLASPLRCPQDAILMGNESTPEIDSAPLPMDPMGALTELVSTYLRQSRYPSIELAAEASGISTRTLQRYLRSMGTSYSGLIDQVRFNTAISLLDDSSITITEIADHLGYTNVSHFSRAFTRIAGMSPRVYRGMLRKQG